jgi:hypothetical protein
LEGRGNGWGKKDKAVAVGYKSGFMFMWEKQREEDGKKGHFSGLLLFTKKGGQEGRMERRKEISRIAARSGRRLLGVLFTTLPVSPTMSCLVVHRTLYLDIPYFLSRFSPFPFPLSALLCSRILFPGQHAGRGSLSLVFSVCVLSR